MCRTDVVMTHCKETPQRLLLDAVLSTIYILIKRLTIYSHYDANDVISDFEGSSDKNCALNTLAAIKCHLLEAGCGRLAILYFVKL